MGNRAFLNVETETNGILVFESNNSLPYFWVGLLNIEILERCKKHWLEYDEILTSGDTFEVERYTDIYPQPTDLIIEKSEFEKNAQYFQAILEEKHPETVSLFVDFKNFIYSKMTNIDDHLSLDIIEISNFSSVKEFYHDLIDQLKELDTRPFLGKEDLISMGCGFTDDEEFLNNPNYQIALKKIAYYPKRTNQPHRKVTTKKDAIKHIIILLLCPLFSYMAYRGFIAEGLSFWVVTISAINISFYQYSTLRLIEIFKANKKPQV